MSVIFWYVSWSLNPWLMVEPTQFRLRQLLGVRETEILPLIQLHPVHSVTHNKRYYCQMHFSCLHYSTTFRMPPDRLASSRRSISGRAPTYQSCCTFTGTWYVLKYNFWVLVLVLV